MSILRRPFYRRPPAWPPIRAGPAAACPGLGEALARFETEKVDLDGTPILTVITLESVKSPEQLDEERQRAAAGEEATAGAGGIAGRLGGLGRRGARQRAQPETEEPRARSTILTISHELLNVSTGVADGDVSIPEGFEERR